MSEGNFTIQGFLAGILGWGSNGTSSGKGTL